MYVGGAKGALTAYDLAGGETQWAWDGDGTCAVRFARAPHDGRRCPTNRDADRQSRRRRRPGRREVLWRFPSAGAKTWGNVATPIIDGGTVIYPGQWSGTVAFKVDGRGGSFVTTELRRKKPSDHHFSSPVLRDGLLFGLSARPGSSSVRTPGRGGCARGGRHPAGRMRGPSWMPDPSCWR